MSDIKLNKEKSNANTYYNLFAKTVGKFKPGQNILFIHLGNFDVYYNFIANNINCNYFIIEKTLYKRLLKAIFPQIEFIGSEEDKSIIEKLENLNMKFDKIIMNPPYSKNLHLKILEKAIEHLTDDGTCVNLSPIRWLQDPLAKYKSRSDLNKFENSVAKHIMDIKYLDACLLTNLFKAVITMDMGIYTCVSYNTKKNFAQTNKILDKFITKSLMLSKTPISEYAGFSGCFVPVTIIDGGHKERGGGKSTFSFTRNSNHYGDYFVNGISTNGKTLEKCKEDNKMCTNGNVLTWPIIKFDTEVEVKNYVLSTKTLFFKYVYMIEMVDVNVHPDFLPWMGDCINPRTGLKGYESEWTDEDFYEYFGITEEEQKLIEKTMEKYK